MRSAPSLAFGSRFAAHRPTPHADPRTAPGVRQNVLSLVLTARWCRVMNATTYRFGPCEIDEARRALLVHGREVRLQPRVFDLLCYLVRHRERVVSKDELLDALWPGTIVVDNALQRVVSLARGALADVGLGEAVRTYARYGYRFCLDDCAEAVPGDAPVNAPGRVAEARAACERNDWVVACDAYAAADAQAPLPADDVEQWGRAAICAG